MQPYFFPYIGYFQLINAVNEFIIYDNIEFSRKGWVQRNRVLSGNSEAFISLPIKKGSDYLDIDKRFLADSWPIEREKMLNKLKETYKISPMFSDVYPILDHSLRSNELNLFRFLVTSLQTVMEYLDIKTPLIVSSSIDIDHKLKAEDKVLALVKKRNAGTYINPIGGLEFYSKQRFKNNGINLRFLKANNIEYPQFKNQFIPFLSIIDVMMFNTKAQIKDYLKQYTLV